jgi:hypothetical protein
MPGTYDFSNWGVSNNVTPYNFGGTDFTGFSGLNNYGQVSATGGFNAAVPDSLGNTMDASGAAGGLFANSGLGLNIPTLELGLKGIGSAASLFTGLQALGLAKDQFSYQKSMADKNYTNSKMSYNTALEDKANGRASVTGQSAADTAAYIAAHKLS